jgi:hypothetical protein
VTITNPTRLLSGYCIGVDLAAPGTHAITIEERYYKDGCYEMYVDGELWHSNHFNDRPPFVIFGVTP